MSVRDGRTFPFSWSLLPTLDYIRESWDRDRAEVGAGIGLNVYHALTELATEAFARRDTKVDTSDQFKNSAAEIARKAVTSDRSVERACRELERIGLLRIEADCEEGRRQGRASFFTLVEAPQTSEASSDVDGAEETKRPKPVRTSSEASSDVDGDPPNPVRTPPNKEKKKQQKKEELESTADFSILPAIVAAPLRQVAEAKGAAFHPEAVRRACDKFPDVDLAEEAERFAEWQLHGKGQNAKPVSIAGAFRNWLKRAPAIAPGKVTRLQAVQAALSPPDMEKVTAGLPLLEEIWPAVADRLRASVPDATYRLWIAPLVPAGMDGGSVYLSAPEGIRAWAERRYASLIGEALAASGVVSPKTFFIAQPEEGRSAV